MRPTEVLVNRGGSILLGEHVVCDGYEPGRQVGVITHFHADHTDTLHFAVQFSKTVLTTPPTRELILATHETLGSRLERLAPLHYMKSYEFDGERVTLLPAKHVLGASQTLVETKEGSRVLYTGDFLVPGTLPPEADVVITNSTAGIFGAPGIHSRQQVVDSITRFIERLLTGGSVSVIAHQGKLQEVMNALFDRGVNVPFLLPPDVFDVAMIYRKYGIETGECLLFGTSEAEDASRSPHVAFLRPRTKPGERSTPLYIVERPMAPPRHSIQDNYVAGLPIHEDLEGLLWYLGKSGAKSIFVTGERSERATCLAHFIEKHLGIGCKVVQND